MTAWWCRQFDHLRSRLFGSGEKSFDTTVPSISSMSDEFEGAIPEELVDAMLDGEVPQQRAAEIRGVIRSDSEASARLRDTDRILDLLKHTPASTPAPDLSGAILSQVDRRRRFLGSSGLRTLVATRYAVAASLLIGAAIGFMAHRAMPEIPLVARGPAPVKRIVESVPERTAEVLSGVEGLARAAGEIVPAGVRTVRAREMQRLSSHQDLGGCSVVPVMSPRIAAVLWIEPANVPGSAVVARCGDPVRCSPMSRPTATVSLRSIFAEERPIAANDQPSLLASQR